MMDALILGKEFQLVDDIIKPLVLISEHFQEHFI